MYVAVDYGHSGGDHGHPDRLNLLLVDDGVRWLDDMGTGSYVDPSLHWYRSTLAHNAPLVNGRSQARVHGTLLAYDERGAAGWISASAEEIANGASAGRTVVVMPDYVIDELEWRADARAKVDLPLHVDATVLRGAGRLHDDRASGGEGLEDGFRFLESMSLQRSEPRSVVELRAERPGANDPLRIWWQCDHAAEWWRASAPGAPGRGKEFFRFVRAVGDHGVHRSVWCWNSEVASVRFDDGIVVSLADGTTHTHRRTDRGWQVELTAGGSRSSIDLEGWSPDAAGEARATSLDRATPTPAPTLLHVGPEHVVELEEPHYRRSEQSWKEAGRPSATVALSWSGSALRIVVTVYESELTFAPAGAVNPYDNESMDINGDGVQVYLRTDAGQSGWLLVPERESTRVRVRSIDGWTASQPITAKWKPVADGYEVHVELPLTVTSSPLIDVDVVINEKPVGRERRRGQLVMSGASGEFVYLRGDRHDVRRLIPFQLVDG